MRIIPTMKCRPGMRLGRAIYTENGNVLAGYRYELTASVIERLHQMGIHYLYIDEPDTADILIEDPISEETRIKLHTALLGILESVSGSGRLGSSVERMCAAAITMLLDDLDDRMTDAVMVFDTMVAHEDAWIDQWLRNAMQSSIYAAKLGRLEHYDKEDLAAISYGALLHDIGCLRLPSAIMAKSGPLTQEEFELVKTHTTVGYKLLKDEPGIPLLSAHCALFHHERLNQSGYPLKMRGSQIHPFARWVGLIDAYVAMTSPRRYRMAMLPHEAMEVLYAGAGTLFDLDKVETFRDKVVTFPPGISVLLSSGEIGVVSRINRHNKQRPVVRVIKNERGETLHSPYEIDLSARLNVMISRVGDGSPTSAS